MISKVLMSLALLLLLSSTSFAQKSESASLEKQKNEEAPKFKLNLKYPTNVYHKYTLTEETEVLRQFSNDAKSQFKRNVTYFMTLVQNSMPDDGFWTVKITIDSLNYTLSDGSELNLNYFSQDDDAVPPFNNFDFLQYSIPLGREFEITYSPYNDVAKVAGWMLSENRDLINDPQKGIKDQVPHYLWNRGLSDKSLLFLANLHKNLIPSDKVFKDSTYQAPVALYVGNAYYADTASFSVTNFTPREYEVVASVSKFSADEDLLMLPGLKELVKAEASTLDGNIKLNVSPRGQINFVEAELTSIINFNLKKEKVVETTKTKYKWNLDSMRK